MQNLKPTSRQTSERAGNSELVLKMDAIDKLVTLRGHDSGSVDNGMRMLIYSHDTFGLGHLNRCLKISRVLVERLPRLSILIVTGSPIAHRVQFPPRVDYIKLPSVRKVGAEEYEARTLTTPFKRILELRSNLLLQAVQSSEPHIFLADHSPVGMKGELLPALEWLQKSGGDTIRLIGLRDILDAPDTVAALWEGQGIYDVLRNMYDHILIYGTPSVFDLVAAYGFTDDMKQKTLYCNYISDLQSDSITVSSKEKSSDKKPLVVVTTGGGDGAGETVIGTYLEMLHEFESEIFFDSVVVTGPFLPKELYAKFQKAARGLPVSIKEFVPSTRSLLQQSELVVATGGYNTVTDMLSWAKRGLVIPRVMHRKEQLMRARRFSEFGILEFLPPDQVTARSLYSLVKSLLSTSQEPLAEARAKNMIPLDGASRVADLCSKLFESHPSLKGRANE